MSKLTEAALAAHKQKEAVKSAARKALLNDMLGRENIKVVPAAGDLPMLSNEKLAVLGASMVRSKTIHQPFMVTMDGKLLDGRNRLAALKMLGVKKIMYQSRATVESGDEINFQIQVVDTDSVEWIADLNLIRRHMSKQQIAAWIAKYTKAMPKADSAKKARAAQLGDSKNLESPDTDADRAKKAGISQPLITEARKLRAEDPEAADKVLAGEKPKAKRAPAKKAKEPTGGKVRVSKVVVMHWIDEAPADDLAELRDYIDQLLAEAA
jgi:hypothetical protein